MFTPAKLREMAAQQDAIVEQGRAEDEALGFGPGNPGPRWRTTGYFAYKEAERLRFAARYMEHFGIKERAHVGPFGNLNVKKGQRVRIKKGAPLFNMGPTPAERAHKEEHGCHRFAQKNYTVVVSQNYQGWCAGHGFEYISEKYWHENLRDQTIEWAGTGGYWTWTSPEWVEII